MLAQSLWASLALSACGRLGYDLREAVATVPASMTVDTPCGAAAPAVDVPITNDGPDPLWVMDASATGGFVVQSVMPIVIAAGESAMLQVRSPDAVIGTDRAGSQKLSTLTITTNALATPTVEVALVATVIGADLAASDVNGQALTNLDLMGTTTLCPIQLVTIANTGNAPATILIATSTDFGISGFAGGVIDASSNETFALKANTAGPCTGAGQLTYTATGDVCSATPVILQATFTITGGSSCSCS